MRSCWSSSEPTRSATQSKRSSANIAKPKWRLTSNCRWPIFEGVAFILGARLDDDRHAVFFDALRKTDGSSMLGDFRYQPVIFCATRRVRASDRQQLAARAVLLARVQGALPKFLLSRERDMDAFAASKRRRQGASSMEFYPKGYLASSILSLRRGQAARASDTMAAEAE
jgi:hypothetical protein